jgi:hypothetical protein
MIELNLTKKINGDQLCEEIGAQDLYVANDKIIINGDVSKDFAQLKLDAHIPLPKPEPTIADKLASVGLSLEELKAALGGN